MTTDQQAHVSHKRRLGRSVEVQHGRRGVGLMLRRGLHGAKNWVLEPDEDGIPRSPWGKLLRVFVVLTPVWIVLSAVTGGPERGGHQVGLGQAILSALLVTLVGLGFLSARERRQGREEPWSDLPVIDTMSDDAGLTTLVDPVSEEPTEVLENAQVSEVGVPAEADDWVVTPGDIPDVSDQTPQVDTVVAPQGVDTPGREEVGASPFVQVGEGDQPESPSVDEVDTRADETGFPGALEEETPTIRLTPGHPPRQPVTISLEKAPFSQVKPVSEVATENDSGGLAGVTHRNDASNPPESVWPVSGSQEIATQEELFPQVNTVATPLVLASPGPYPVSDGPIAGDWWLTRTDVEPAAEEDTAKTADSAFETADEADDDSLEEGQPEGPLALDQAVLAYLAVRSMPDASEEMKEATRQEAARWAREEIDAGRQSQRSAAKVLGVSKTTVAKWLGRETEGPRDPWAGVDVE